MNATSMDIRVERLEAEVNALKSRTAVDEVHRINIEKRLEGIEDTLKWLVRLIFGSVILAGVAFLLGGGLQL